MHHTDYVLAAHRPCHYAISNGRSVAWVAKHTTCWVDAGSGQLTIDIAQEPRCAPHRHACILRPWTPTL